MTTVVRAGNTVRRAPPEDPEFVRALLGLFERRGWAGAPRFLGTDERGREVLSFHARVAANVLGIVARELELGAIPPEAMLADHVAAKLAVANPKYFDAASAPP